MPMSNAERQRRWRERTREKVNANQNKQVEELRKLYYNELQTWNSKHPNRPYTEEDFIRKVFLRHNTVRLKVVGLLYEMLTDRKADREHLSKCLRDADASTP